MTWSQNNEISVCVPYGLKSSQV